MAYEIYQSRYKGYEIDNKLDDVGELKTDVTELKQRYDANKVIMPDTTTLPVYLANHKPDIELSTANTDNILEKKTDGYYVPPVDLSNYDDADAVDAKISAATTDMATNASVAADIAAAAYVLPKATNTTLGGVMVDNTTITVDANGVISGASSIDKIEDIGDVTLTDIQTDQALIWNGTGWVNGTVATSGGSGSGGTIENVTSQIAEVKDVNIKVGPSNTHPITLYTYTNDSKEDVYVVLNGLSSTDTGSNQGFLSAELDNVQFSKLLLTTGVNMATCFTTQVGPGQEFSVKGDWTGSHSGCSWAITGSLIVYTKSGAGDLYLSYEDYSEEERVVGKWTDGKPIYRKIIQTTTPKVTTDGTNVEKTISIADLGVDKCISLSGFFINTVNATVMFNSAIALTFSKPYAQMLWCSNANIGMDVNRVSYGDRPATIIIEYTKTADAENSFLPSMVTNNVAINVAPSYEDYSEDEIVIGKWIDGKPVYRKMITGSPPTVAKDGTFVTKNFKIADNIENIIQWYGRIGVQPITYITNGGLQLKTYVSLAAGELVVSCSNTSFNSAMVYIFVEYTKTTDAENSFSPDMIKTIPLTDEVKESDVAEILSVLGG